MPRLCPTLLCLSLLIVVLLFSTPPVSAVPASRGLLDFLNGGKDSRVTSDGKKGDSGMEEVNSGVELDPKDDEASFEEEEEEEEEEEGSTSGEEDPTPTPSISPSPDSTPSPSPIPSADGVISSELGDDDEGDTSAYEEDNEGDQDGNKPDDEGVVGLQSEDGSAESSGVGNSVEEKSGGAGIVGVAVGGVSVLVLAGIALAILAPAVLIYWAVRRRNSGFENMPAVDSQQNTYRGQGVDGRFAVGEE